MLVIRAALAASLLIGALSPVLADPVSDYSYWRIAGTLDDTCHYLKFVERLTINEVAFDALEQTGQYAHLQDGRMTQERYNAWADEVEAQADAVAAGIGCTEAAAPYLNTARAKASEQIYQNLLLAFHFGGLPETDTNRLALGADQMEAAQRYDMFLQQIYTTNFQTFAQLQRDSAVQRLPAGGSGYDEFGMPVFDFGFGAYDPDAFDKVWDAQAAALLAVQSVHFEVSAETNGMLVWRRKAQKYNEVPTLHKADTGALVATVFDGPSIYRLDTGEDVFGVFTQLPDGRLRLMTYGTAASDKLTSAGVARLFVRSEDPPEGVADYALFDLPDFRMLTFPFDGIPVDEPCLGGPCWDFSLETAEALYQGSPNEYAELWLSADPEAAPSATIDVAKSYLRGRVRPALLWPINDKPQPAAKTN